ncbi:MAG TPA: flavodoxin domain-containing protein [Syntrophorhabdaceae bacterium]|jgi:menaquinone-dependent protoporphyrinogen oxidase
MKRDFTRREFIWAGSLLAGCGAAIFAPGGRTLSAGKAHAGGVDFVEPSCLSREKTGKRVLVAYASRCGTTGGVAEAMGRTLCDAGFDVDTRLAKHVEDVSPYGAVVLGSAIDRASWLTDAIKFAEKNREALSRVPVAYFLTCVTLYQDTAETRKLAQSYMEPVLRAVPEVRPVDTGHFAGVLDYGKLNVVLRMVMKAKMQSKGVPEGDFRNWNAITSWAKGLAAPFGSLKTTS